MTSNESSSTPQYATSLSHPAVVTHAVHRVLPALRSLSQPLRQAMRKAPPEPMPWLDDATAFSPELLEELQRQHVRFRSSEQQVQRVLSTIPAVEAFAEPLLVAAIEKTFQLSLDVRKTFVFNPGRMQIDDSFVSAGDLVTNIVRASKRCTASLLSAALQNFQAHESEAGGMDGHGARAQVFTTPSGEPMDLETLDIAIAPERFAALCRELDLGARYKVLVSAAFAPPPGADESALAALINRRGIFKLFEQASLRLHVHLAYLQGRVGEALYQRVVELTRNQSPGRGATERCSFLRLWDVELCGVVLFRSPGAQANGIDRVLLYVPDDPQFPLKEFPSASACYRDLRDRLLQPDYRTFFLRFIPARHRTELMQRLKKAVNPSVWNAGGWYEEGFDKNATLPFTEQALDGPLLSLMLEQKIRVLKDDGLFQAVPTAQKDDESAQERALALASVAFNVLNVAAFVVPGLGEVMLAVTAAQLGYEVYEGFDSLARGEREQAWGYLMDVAENVLTGAALVAVTGGGAGVALPAKVRAMRAVRRPFGAERLWAPDIAPYAHSVELPDTLAADAKGLYSHEGRQWLKLEGHTYAVQARDDSGYVIEHPSRRAGYQPTLRHNEEGGWLHELEQPDTWPGHTLARRLGPRYAELPDSLVQQAMAVSGINEPQLRQALISAARPPAVFADTVERFRLARQLEHNGKLDPQAFEAGYRQAQPALSESGEVLQRAFPGLPNRVVDELLRQATAEELTQLRSTRRVPQRLAEEARAFQQEVRLARAYEGLFFDPAGNPDSALLMPLGQGGLPLMPRAEARRLLKMQPLRPGFRSPMRLANGRIGFPLSGGVAGLILRDTLLDKVRLLQLDTLQPEEVVERLSNAGLARMAINERLDELLEQQRSLRVSLDRWAEGSASARLEAEQQQSRTAIHDALWTHWEANLLPELGRTPEPLTLETLYFVDFPTDLPAFFRDSVNGLVLRYVRAAPVFEQHQAFADLGAGWPTSLGQFRQLSSLEVVGTGWRTSLPREIAECYPQLEELRLIENGLRLDGMGIDALGRLPRLRRLNLSGNRLSNVFNIERFTLTLAYLGMDSMRLDRWPRWLDAEAMARIGELSLADNYLDELPAMVVAGDFQQQWGRRLSLRGNPLSWQVLLDLRLAEGAPIEISYRLRTPMNARDLALHLAERAELAEMLDLWTAGWGAETPVEPEEVAERRRLSTTMLDFWREDLRQDGSVVLRLEGLSVASFPSNLPAFFYQRVRWMELREFQGSTAELDSFLRMFPRVVDLGLTGARTALTQLPEALVSLEELGELALVRLGMTIGQAEMELLERMPALCSLQLDGNQLGVINLPVPLGPSLTYLSLAEMHLSLWPEWLTEAAQRGVEMINLEGNQLTELPEVLLANRRRDLGAVEIILRNNPLTTETMTRAHCSQDFNRPYCFTMDLPLEIESMSRTPHSSDSEGSMTDDEGIEQGWAPQSVSWDVAGAGEGERFAAAWEVLLSGGQAAGLLRLIDRLRLSADYRTRSSRAELIARVLRVMEAAGQDPALCQLLNAMAEEPLRQYQHHETCPDGIRLEFNQMEIHVYTQEALRGIDPQHRASGLFLLMRRLFRSQQLDIIAREQAGSRDQAEVRLAYRLRWSNELELPEPPRHMLYRSSADIRTGELDMARNSLGQAERGRPLLDYAASCEFWTGYLREAFAIRFAVLKEAFEAQVLELIDLYPEDAPEQSSARVRQLEATYQEDERALIDELTIAERSLHDL